LPKQVNPIYADPVRAKVIITLEIGENEVKTATPIKAHNLLILTK